MKLAVAEARALAQAAMKAIGFEAEEALATADHLVDAGLRGVTFGSLARVLAIAERLDAVGGSRRPLAVQHETSVSALLDGGDHVGYFVAREATALAIQKAQQQGLALVGANNTYYTGLFSYYMEMATREGLVAMAAGNGPAIVAPEGAAEARLGTNPIAFGFPADPDPVIWDIGTCAIMHGELLLHRRTGTELPEGVALDRDGRPTRNPVAALDGAIRAWGGHKGSGLAVAVQFLGALCGGPVIASGMSEMAYLVLVIDPKILLPAGGFAASAAELAERLRSARPLDPSRPVRMPFERSAAERRRRLAEGAIEVPDPVHKALRALAEGRR